MSRTGSIFLYSANIDSTTFTECLSELLKEEWTYNKYGNISFMVNDSYDWQTGNLMQIDEILKSIETSINNKESACLDFLWIDKITIIGVQYLNSKTLMINISENIYTLNNIYIIDFTWYLSKLSNLLKFLDPYRIQCNYG